MNEKLIAPILERIGLGYSKEEIKKEVMGFGYGETDFEAAYSIALARSGQGDAGEADGAEVSAEEVGQPATEAPVEEKKSNKSMIVILIGLIVVIIGISGVVLAYNTGMF